MNLWLEATHTKCEAFFEMKLSLYAEAFAGLMSSYHDCTANDAILTVPLRVPKLCTFADATEQALHDVYNTLENGYTLTDEDTVAFAHAMRSCAEMADGNSCVSPTDGDRLHLYGELTSSGVRQLHRLVCEGIHHVTPRSDKERQTLHNDTAVVVLDVGSGTGKVLFEWSRLAQGDGWRWAHVGVELAPSRMRIAHAAMPASRVLRRANTTHRWRIASRRMGNDPRQAERPTGESAGGESGWTALCEADIFADGLLSGDTLHAVADALQPVGRRHVVVYCCGLGFAYGTAKRLCAALESIWCEQENPFAPSSPQDTTNKVEHVWQTMTCVLLLRPFEELCGFPLFRLCRERVSGETDSMGQLRTLHLDTTWMNEAPAWLLTLHR